MEAIVTLLAIFILILILSRKVPIGASLLAGAVILGLVFRMEGKTLAFSVGKALVEPRTLELAGLIILILALNEALKESRQLERLMEACQRLLPDVRLVVFALPSLIGLLPMPGGAYFSAPMVAGALDESEISAERKAFANYWFRHLWEYIFPLYPGLIMMVALSGVGLRAIVRVNVFLTITAALYGMVTVFGHRESRFQRKKREARFSSFWLKEFLIQFSPVLLVIVLALIFNLYIIYALCGGLLAVYLLNRVGFRFIAGTIKRGMSPRMLLMIAGVMVFKQILAESGAVEDIAAYLKMQNAGLGPILFTVPFLSGLVTGYTVAFVGVSLPILLPLLGEPQPAALMFIYASGFAGVLLSPVHLCLLLTKEYFGTTFFSIYRYVIPGTAAITVAGLIGYLLLT